MRLIDADALLAEYDRVHEGPPGKARMLIENAPTIEPERKKGRWVAIEGKDDCFECSECHSVIEGNEVYWRDNYFCYHCGADMR